MKSSPLPFVIRHLGIAPALGCLRGRPGRGLRCALPILCLLTTILLCTPHSAPAQVVGFGSPITITGTTNSPAVDTNAPSIPVRKINATLTSANSGSVTGAVANVWLSPSPTNLANAFLLGTASFGPFTNANISSSLFYTNPTLYTVLQLQTGTNPISVQEVYGP
ncbi:MAG: hypothetical protein ABSG59_18265 [Verrucomicrobiota bacterium]